MTAIGLLGALIGAAIMTSGGTARAASDKQCDRLVLAENELLSVTSDIAEDVSLDGQLLNYVRPRKAIVLRSRKGICLSNFAVLGAGDRQRQGIRLQQHRQRGRIELSDLEVAGSVVLLNLGRTKAPINMRRVRLSGARVCMRLTRSTKLAFTESTLVGCRIEKVGHAGKRPLRVRFHRSVLILYGHPELDALLKLSKRGKDEAHPRINFARNTIYVQNSEAVATLDELFDKKGVTCAGNEIVVISGISQSKNGCRSVRSADAAEVEMVQEAMLRSDAQKAGRNPDDEAWIMPRPGPRLACPA